MGRRVIRFSFLALFALAAWTATAFCGANDGGHLYAASKKDKGAASAEALYGEARVAYKAGELDRALDLLQRAYDLEARPIFVYNIGRIQAARGQLREAYELFLKVLALDGLDDDLRRLTGAQADKLKGMVDKAVLRIVDPPEGTLVQIGSRAVKKLDQDQVLEPGGKQACAVMQKGARIVCTRLELAAGNRLDWQPQKSEGATGKLMWKPVTGAQAIVLNGESLLADAEQTWEIVVDVGRHDLEVVKANGSSATAKVHILPNAKKELAPLFGGAEKKAGEAAVREEVPSRSAPSSAGVWPWVVTGVGGALLGAGFYFYSDGAAMLEESEGVPNDNQPKAVQLYDDGNAKWDLGVTLMGVGAAAVVGGVTWWALAPDSAAAETNWRGEPSGIWVRALPNGTVFLGGRF